MSICVHIQWIYIWTFKFTWIWPYKGRPFGRSPTLRGPEAWEAMATGSALHRFVARWALGPAQWEYYCQYHSHKVSMLNFRGVLFPYNYRVFPGCFDAFYLGARLFDPWSFEVRVVFWKSWEAGFFRIRMWGISRTSQSQPGIQNHNGYEKPEMTIGLIPIP